MQFSSSLVLAALPMLTFAAPPFPNTTYLFSGAISLAKIPPPVPLVTGSTLNTEIVSNGTFGGPALNGTITAGLIYPVQTTDGALRYPQQFITGMTNDNVSFATTSVGVGPTNFETQFLTFKIGGKYSYLQEIYIVQKNSADRATEIGSFDAWCVDCNQTVIDMINCGGN